MKENILIISPEYPYPANHGGRAGVLARIEALYTLGYNVVLASFFNQAPKENEIKYLKQYCTDIFLLPRQKSLYRLFSLDPYQVRSRGIESEIEPLFNLNIFFSHVFIEGHYVASFFISISKRLTYEKSYLRVHNNETLYFRMLAKSENNFIRKVLYLSESIKFLHYEKKIMRPNSFSSLLHVSCDERKAYQEKYPEIQNIFFPANVDLNRLVKDCDKSLKEERNAKNVLFIGSLFMPNNISALKWYLEEVHPIVTKEIPKYTFLVAGNMRDENEKLENYLRSFHNVEFHRSPDTLDFLYRNSLVFVNPMLEGAGVKMKTLHAILNAVPVVSTKIGAEGIGLTNKKDILITNHNESFANSVTSLLNSYSERKRICRNAQDFILNNYNAELNLKKILR